MTTIAKNNFHRKSTAEEVTEGLDLTGKTILITGVASGLGKEAMRVLSMRGAHVIGLDRTLDAAAAACTETGENTAPFACDLADPDSITACTNAIKSQYKMIDVVLTNAGIMAPPYMVVDKYTKPLEIQFAVNYLGHFILINQLFDLVKAAPAPRLALVASEGYATAPKKNGINFDDLDFSKAGYNALTAYGMSKLAVMLMNVEYARRLEGSHIISNSVHPGVIRTNLASDSKSFAVKLISAFAGPWTRSIAAGAATHCFVAVHPSLDGVNGQHFADCNPKTPTRDDATDAELAAKLWDTAYDLAGDYLHQFSVS